MQRGKKSLLEPKFWGSHKAEGPFPALWAPQGATEDHRDAAWTMGSGQDFNPRQACLGTHIPRPEDLDKVMGSLLLGAAAASFLTETRLAGHITENCSDLYSLCGREDIIWQEAVYSCFKCFLGRQDTINF